MYNDLTEFEADWLLELAINGSGRIPAAIAAHLRELGYAEWLFSTTCVTRKGREKLMAGMQLSIGSNGSAGPKLRHRPGMSPD